MAAEQSGLARALVDHVRALSASDHPGLVTRVRLHVADHVALARAGRIGDAVVAARRWLATTESGWLTDAMIAAIAAHSTEMDDTHGPSSTHPGVVVVPTALAVGAHVNASEAALVEAIARGYEAMARLGELAGPSVLYGRGLHPTGYVGGLAAAITAADLLGVDADTQTAAVGIAAAATAGTMSFLVDGAWTKRLQPALAVRTGVDAALLADAGFVAPRDGIGGPAGFLALAGSDPRPKLRLSGSGPAIFETGLKPYACCRYIQPAIDAALQLRHGDCAVDDVESVTVGLPSVAIPIVAEPAALKCRPASEVDAQFSAPYAVAVALAEGRAGPREFANPLAASTVVLELAARTTVVADPRLDAAYPNRWGAWVRLSGRRTQDRLAEVRSPLGDPDRPMQASAFAEKLATIGVADPLIENLLAGGKMPASRALLAWSSEPEKQSTRNDDE